MMQRFSKSIEARREEMVVEHLLQRGIRDPHVIKAMREVPREAFVSPGMEDLAYDDRPLPIDEGQTISQPYIVAYMIEALALSPGDRVLEIGTGSGYAAAVLGRIVDRVYTIERLGGLAGSARHRLTKLGFANVVVQQGDGTLGWPEYSPYDAIIVSAGAPEVPSPLLDQLAIDGRLVVPVGQSSYLQELVRVRRVGEGDFRTEYLCGVSFVPLIGEAGWKR